MNHPINQSAAHALAIDKLEVHYQGITALRGVSLQIKQGEIFTLIGPNGAGKSSLVNAVTGIVPSTGSIEFGGREFNRLPSYQRARLGVIQVPEGRRVISPLSVLENLMLGREALGARKGDVQADLERVFSLFPILAERRQQLSGTLSGGQQQMLAIARALISEPKVLVLDEPTEGIQPSIIKEIAQTLNTLRAERGFAIVVSEQVLSFALDLCDRFLVIDRGRLVHDEARASLDQDKVRSFLTV